MAIEDKLEQRLQNKGEWSEFYAFIQLLSDGFVDMETSTDTDRKRTKVLSVKKDGINFVITNDDVFTSEGVAESRDVLRAISAKILKSILNGSKVFAVPEADLLSEMIGVSTKKQTSSSIADLFATIRHEDRDSEYDLSIKSWLGASPSFFNASKISTRIHYKISGDISNSILSALRERKATGNVKAIYLNGGYLELNRYANPNFFNGLEFVNSDGPAFFADLVVAGFLSGKYGSESSVKKDLPSIALALDIFKDKYRLFATIRNRLMFEARVKNLLYYILMYQLQSGPPETMSANAPDNYLAVLSDGKLLCIVGREKLQEKLFNLCKMDSPASGTNKHDYGNVYENDGEWYIDLQPGIRLARPR